MKDIDDYIHSCVTCQRVNKRNEKPSNLLHCIEVTSSWHRIGVDLIVSLPRTASGNSYVVTCDYFTKWPDAMALPDKSAAGVAKFLDVLITRHGCPSIIQTDQGREFVNQVNYI